MLSATARKKEKKKKHLPLSRQFQQNNSQQKTDEEIKNKNDVLPMWRREVIMPPCDMVHSQNDIT